MRVVSDAVTEWDLPGLLGLVLVSDNASNMMKAGKLLGCHMHLGCFAHTINLAVQKALKVEDTERILKCIRRMSTFFHRSHQAAHLLKTKAHQLQLTTEKLKTDVPTRWNSAFDMLTRFLYMQPAVVLVIRSKELSALKEREICSLNDEETVAAEELETFLKPLKDITTYMCSEEMPTSSIIMPLCESLIGSNGHLRPKEGDSPAIAEMKSVMTADLQTRYTEQKEMLNVTSALDPRFKSFPYLTPGDRDNVFRKLTNVAVTLHPKPVTTAAVKEEPGTSATPPPPAVEAELELQELGEGPASVKMEVTEATPAAESASSKPSCLLDSLLHDVYVTHVEPAKGTYQLCTEEVERYREERGIKMSENPLLWWKKNEPRYPLLARAAKMYLSIPATSVPSERVFSTAGDILTEQRARLKPMQLDRLLFLKKNME